MNYKYFASLIILLLILAACVDTPVTDPDILTESPNIPTTYPGPILSTEPASPYPEPSMDNPQTNLPAYPGPDTSGKVTPAVPPSGYEPQPGDENFKRGPVFLDMANSQIVSTGTASMVGIILNGDLPDPCHELRVVVTPADAKNVINLEAYSVVKPGGVCITVLEPFTASIPLGSYPEGFYTVMVNGEKLGEFGSSYAPQPGDARLKRDKVFMDMENSSLLVMESYPVQVSAQLNGSLSDPCHQLRVVVVPANTKNEIKLEVYSVVDPNKACIAVIQPFSANIPLGNFKDGHYLVTVNGEWLGEFDA